MIRETLVHVTKLEEIDCGRRTEITVQNTNPVDHVEASFFLTVTAAQDFHIGKELRIIFEDGDG